jgi:hypothetical protein
VPCHGQAHFLFDAICRRHEVGAHEQKDDVGFVKMLVDFGVPVIAGTDHPARPDIDQAFAAEGGQMLVQIVRAVRLRVGIRAEDR